jgi:hypothetical protein
VDEFSDRLLHVLSELEEIADSVTPAEAVRHLEESTLQLFWREWPHVSSWAGSLWRVLNEDIAGPATSGEEIYDIGGSD